MSHHVQDDFYFDGRSEASLQKPKASWALKLRIFVEN